MAEPVALTKPKHRPAPLPGAGSRAMAPTLATTVVPPIVQRASANGSPRGTSALEHEPGNARYTASASPFALVAERSVQTKLVVDRGDDPWEREADRVAQHVVDGPPDSASPTITPVDVGALDLPMVQRSCCAGCDSGGACENTSEMEPEEEQEAPPLIQRLSFGLEVRVDTSGISQALATRPAGDALPERVQRTLESRMGVGLEGVRVHTGGSAVEMTRALGARAFTQGRDVWLGAGESPHDLRLMAHEATHVVQQGRAQDAPVAPAVDEESDALPPPAVALPSSTRPTQRVAPPPDVRTRIPPAPTAPSRSASQRIARVGGAMATEATAQSDLPDAAVQAEGAHRAVAQPESEALGEVNEAEIAAVAQIEPPSADIEALCVRIREVIRARRPADEDELVYARPREMAQEASAEVATSASQEVAQVSGTYDGFEAPATPRPADAPPLVAQPDAMDVAHPEAASAVPDAVPAERVSLDGDVADADQRLRDAGMESPAAREVQDGPIADARGERDALVTMAARDPAAVLAEQAQAREQAATDLTQLQRDAVIALARARRGTAQAVTAQQGDAVTTEAATRDAISRQANLLFATAQQTVTATLDALPERAMRVWDTEIERLSGAFETRLASVARWIDERHSGVIGSTATALWDWATGLPDWVIRAYNEAEQTFADGVCALARQVSSDVNTTVATCERLIATTSEQIDALFTGLPESLQSWADGERARYGRELGTLATRAQSTRQDFTQQLGERAADTVQQVRERIENLRTAAQGIVGRIADHIRRFLDDPVLYIVNGLLRILGIRPASFWRVVDQIRSVIDEIVDDPLPFANNLARAVGRGFALFFEHLRAHLLRGFLVWLFGNVEGLEVPREFSARAVLGFFLQLMGITWQRIRAILARQLGERNVALIERAWSLFTRFMQRGWDGMVELVKDVLDPIMLVGRVVEAAVSYMVQAIVERVAARIALMFVPGGAIIQALEIIYRVLSWIFQNAARIFTLIETIVGGIRDLLGGAIDGMARRVERALGVLVPAVISFVAGFFGLNDLPARVAETVSGMREWVEGLIDRAVAAVVRVGRGLLQRMGLGGEEPPTATDDGEIGSTERFVAGGASHRLWIAVQGSNAQVMVASVPETVAEKLTRWDASLGTPQSPLSTDETSEARRLIPQVRAQLTTVAADASQAVVKDQAAAAPGATPELAIQAKAADDATEQGEREMLPALSRLFELFGELSEERRRLQFLPLIAADAPTWAQARAREVHDDWARDQLPRATYSAPPIRLFNGTGAFAATEGEALGLGRTPAIHDDFYVGYVAPKPGLSPNMNRGSFGAWAFTHTSDDRAHRMNFLRRLGDAAATKLGQDGAATIASSNLPDAVKQPLADAYRNGVTWEPNARSGRFAFPSDESGEHGRFMPVSIVEETQGDRGIVHYTTLSGQQFTVEVTDGRLVQRIAGTGLQLMTGRGYTGDSPASTRHQGFNAAHLIANEFGGSGYARSLNLVTTSWEYNQQSMRRAELVIGRIIERFARQYLPDEPTITFDVQVDVQWGEILDATILAEIKKEAWYPRDPARDLEQEIRAKIVAGAVNGSLRRVMGISYTWSMYGPDRRRQGPHTYNLGPDRWILAGTLGPGQTAGV